MTSHPRVRDWRKGREKGMCPSCYKENGAWVLRDGNGGGLRCPWSGDRYRPLHQVVGIGWQEKYRTMIETVGPLSCGKERGKAASSARLVGVSEPEIALEVEA